MVYMLLSVCTRGILPGMKNSNKEGHDEDLSKEGADVLSGDAPVRDEEVSQHNTPAMTLLDTGSGPYCAYPLIKSVPPELEYTCFTAYDKNIYLGTRTGELLHYFELEPLNYMLISQTTFDPGSNAPIEKIKVLPGIERALILSENRLKLYLLPEFAPVPNTQPMDGVTDFAVALTSGTPQRYPIYVSSEDRIYLVQVTTQVMTKAMMLDFQSVKRLFTRGNSLVVATAKEYQLFNLKTSVSTPLFYVNEGDQPVEPIIRPFTETEFLMICSSGQADAAMALIVNESGDLTRGTIAFEKQPHDIQVSFPFIFTNMGNSGIYVYKLEANSQPSIVQKIKHGSSKLCLEIAPMPYEIVKSDQRELVVEKLRLMPLYAAKPAFRIEHERMFVERQFKESSNIVLFYSGGVYLLQRKLEFLDLDNYDENTIGIIERLLENSKDVTPFDVLQKAYLQTMLLLLRLLHSDIFEHDLATQWCIHLDQVDIRLLLYACGYNIYGDLWIYNGLLKLISEMRKIKLTHKFTDPNETIRTIYQDLKHNYSSKLRDSENVYLSFDMILLNKALEHEEEISISDYNFGSLPTIAAKLEEGRDKHWRVLLRIYEKLLDLPKCLELNKCYRSSHDFSKYLLEHANELVLDKEYKETGLLADIIMILNAPVDEKVQSSIVSNILGLLELAHIDSKTLITSVNNSASKVVILEKLGIRDNNEATFLFSFYMEQLEANISVSELWNDLAILTTKYSQELIYTKPPFSKYLETKLSSNTKFEEFMRLREKISNLPYDRLLAYQNISKIDIGDVLILLFFKVEELMQFTTEGKLLEIFKAVNDFMSIEKLVSETTFLQVLQFYMDAMSDKTLLSFFLRRNFHRLTHADIIIQVLSVVPDDCELSTLSDKLFSVFRNYYCQKHQQDILKALLKQELSSISTLIKTLDPSTEN
ncbi:AaceriAFR341Cp [[Ashbya] aceris (nom. inval.)]|nr:AaceriAFR341Cp [[Ashbya] aceris (nom. inval.)]